MPTLLERLSADRKAKRDQLNAIIPLDDAEATFTSEDDQRSGELIAEIAKLDERIKDLSELEAREQANADARVEFSETATRSESATVTSEPGVYVRKGEHSWFADAFNARFGQDSRAADRLQRYENQNRVEHRDLATGAFGALIPPQYLVDLFAPNLRSGRPTANAVQSLPLPPTGMSFSVPRGTTATTTAVQATENATVSETDFDETTLTIDVRTIAGQQDMSRQAFERGSGLDELLFADLSADYAVALDRQVLSGSGVSGQMLGILSTVGVNSVTYTDSTATVQELWTKMADAIQKVVTNRFMPPTAWVMHPRRWAWFTSAMDTAGRPLVTNTAPQNPAGVGDAAAYGQVVGQIMGLPVITDASIPTIYNGAAVTGGTEDPIICARMPDLLLWENGPEPRQLKFEETAAGNLTIKLVVYGFAAFTAGRYPSAITIMTGTGFAPPTF